MRGTLVLLAVTLMILSSPAYAEVEKDYYPSGQLKGEAYIMDGALISQKKYDENGNLESDQDSPTE